jgi:sugar phosphate permease
MGRGGVLKCWNWQENIFEDILPVVVMVGVGIGFYHYHNTHWLQRFYVRIPGVSGYVFLADTLCVFRILFRSDRFSTWQKGVQTKN